MELNKFSKEDLKKTYDTIGEYLKKTDETQFDPNQTTDEGAHEEDSLKGKTKKLPVPTGGGTETKKEFPTDDKTETKPEPTEQITDTSQTDVLTQILQLLQEIRGKIATPVAPTPPAPTDQVQLSAETPTPTPTPATTTPAKSDININVTKSEVIEVLKGMGLSPSEITKKPKQDTSHPIEKGNSSIDFVSKIGKMQWSEIHNMNDELNSRSRDFY